MRTVADRRVMQLEPHTLDFLKGLEAQGEPPLYTLSPADARNVLVSAKSGQILGRRVINRRQE